MNLFYRESGCKGAALAHSADYINAAAVEFTDLFYHRKAQTYALVLAHIGPVAMAVTSALNYQFLRPCRPGPVMADAYMLRLGKRLAVMDVRVWTDDPDKPIGQANVTYAIP